MLAVSFSAFSQIQCVVIEWNNDSTNFSVVNYNYTPASLPIVGLSPSLEVLVKRKPFVVPEYDSRLKILGISNSISLDYDSEYTTNRKWVEEYILIDRGVIEKLTSVDEAENFANYKVMPSKQHLKYLAFACAATWRKANGMTNTQRELNFMDKFMRKALKMYKNDILAEQKKDSLNAGNLVDLDYGWEDTDTEN